MSETGNGCKKCSYINHLMDATTLQKDICTYDMQESLSCTMTGE